MPGSERRRQTDPERGIALRSGSTPQQRMTLQSLEGFQRGLAFVRCPLFRDPLPVALDRSRKCHLVIEPDGSINENPGLAIRRARTTALMDKQ